MHTTNIDHCFIGGSLIVSLAAGSARRVEVTLVLLHSALRTHSRRLICSCALRACWGSRRARMRMEEREIFENQQVHDTLSLDSAYEAKIMEVAA